MLAATSWAARLKAGLARTREALGTRCGRPARAPQARRRAVRRTGGARCCPADCGVDATRALLDDLRGRAKKQRIEDGAALKTALKAALLERLAPLERALDTGAHKPCVIVVAGVNGSGKTTSIGKLAKWLQARARGAAGGRRHVPRGGARAARRLGRAQTACR
jgi:fused signal recognition particle receptor